GRAVQFLGAISYSLYVLHTTIGWRLVRLSGSFIDENSPRPVMILGFSASIAICVVTAWIGWRLLEKPSMRFSQRIVLPQRTEAEQNRSPSAA
ncbi:unnamed protein product, partial [marine sediment metagenome]